MLKILIIKIYKMESFDLARALKGDPVITRQGESVDQFKLFECDDFYPVVAVIHSRQGLNRYIMTFTREGRAWGGSADEDMDIDLFMEN